jgi:hypothetical protein
MTQYCQRCHHCLPSPTCKNGLTESSLAYTRNTPWAGGMPLLVLYNNVRAYKPLPKILIEWAAIIFHRGSGGGCIVATIVFGIAVLDGKGVFANLNIWPKTTMLSAGSCLCSHIVKQQTVSHFSGQPSHMVLQTTVI